MEPESIEIRRIPYPYRAMLAVCSDLDDTPDGGIYRETMRFLNTTEETSMGPGVHLEVGNSIYFDAPRGQFSYWNTDEAHREMLRTLIRSGHVDCLHSYGDLAAKRAHAGRALDELSRYGLRFEVWVDHARAATNFGTDVTRGCGDVPSHEAYHADLTVGQGVRFVWRGRVSSVIGQDVPARWGGLWTQKHPIASARTLSKEAAKHLLGRCGQKKYAMHHPNQVLRRISLRDGSCVFEFMRSNPHWGGVSSAETPSGIAQVLTDEVLGRLIDREGVCILYTHLGKIENRRIAFPVSTVAAFRRLARAQRDRKVLVATTGRILKYLALRDHLEYSVRREGNLVTIHARPAESAGGVTEINSADDLGGLTFYVPTGVHCRLSVNRNSPVDLQINPPDHTNRPSASLPWRRLELPKL